LRIAVIRCTIHELSRSGLSTILLRLRQEPLQDCAAVKDS
jgi:hypothetical protein